MSAATSMPIWLSLNAMPVRPATVPRVNGVFSTSHVRPPSRLRRSRAPGEPVAMNTARASPCATHRPLAAKAPSPGRGAGTAVCANNVHVAPSLSVCKMLVRPPDASLKATPVRPRPRPNERQS